MPSASAAFDEFRDCPEYPRFNLLEEVGLSFYECRKRQTLERFPLSFIR